VPNNQQTKANKTRKNNSRTEVREEGDTIREKGQKKRG
jgi:hypothetical protein